MHALDTMGLNEAAEYLHCQPSTLRDLACNLKVPGAKIGHEWVFVREHLAAYVKNRYDQAVQSGVTGKESRESICQSTREKIRPIGKSNSKSAGSSFRDHLEQKAKQKRK